MTNPISTKSLIAPWKILDLGDCQAAFCGRLLADLGAEVIKVEPLSGGASRKSGPFLHRGADSEDGYWFRHVNLGKKSITLDLDKRSAWPIFRKMAVWADVIIQSRQPEWFEERGLGYQVLSRDNPGLILASITPFGSYGPRRDYQATDETIAAYGGQTAVTGQPTEPPRPLFGRQTYQTSGLFAAIGILAALDHRARTGSGVHLELSLQAAATAVLEHVLVQYNYDRKIAERTGQAHWNGVFAVLPCMDGFFLLTPFRNWETLTALLAAEEAADDLVDPAYLDPTYRQAQRDHVLDVLAAWTRTKTRAELFELGGLLREPWASVVSPGEVLRSPQLQARSFFTEFFRDDSNQTVVRTRLPALFSGQKVCGGLEVPYPGEHNHEFYLHKLGFSPAELDRFRDNGLI